jgi:hypothetical protein
LPNLQAYLRLFALVSFHCDLHRGAHLPLDLEPFQI